MKKVLIVDDSPLARQVVRAAVQASIPQCEMVEAGDGAAALRLLGTRGFDLVVCDLNMPVLDGQGLIVRMRGLPLHKRTPVMVLSSLVNDALAAQLRASGANVVVKKPFTHGQMRDSFKQLGVLP
jgi:two-component system chemotaxis response regulator CheY